MTRVGGRRLPIAEKLWRIAIVTAAGAMGIIADAQAAHHYWSDFDAEVSSAEPPPMHRRKQARHHASKSNEAPEAAKPQGPLIISISIQDQKLRIYDANGFYAESPVSTGMPGHSTPMGVFSVIQKQKLHHSNIYSGAPMPYMQRITWSGIAIHAGVLPGHPASHGCIRMPMAFAIKMWNWTRMGERVIVTPGDMTPASFTHPLLAAQKTVPQPNASTEPPPNASPAAPADKAADAATPALAISASLDLRTTIGRSDGGGALRDHTHSADASNDLPSVKGSAAPAVSENTVSLLAGDAAHAVEAKKTETMNLEDERTTPRPDAMAAWADKPSEEPSSEARLVETKSVAGDASGSKSGDATTTALPAPVSIKTGPPTDAKKLEPKADEIKNEAPKPDAPVAGAKPGAIEAGAGARLPDLKKDQVRLPDVDKPAVAKPDPVTATSPKRNGQIAVFISRKDSKLYARQNFEPLFEVPVTVAPSDRPLGTHVFTAQVDKNDANVLHWSVVSLPVPAARRTERRDDERTSRRRKIAGPVEIKEMPAPDSPTEALDRLTIPAEAMARVTDALTTGGSIIVSDQGINAGETGEGTDFIVSLR